MKKMIYFFFIKIKYHIVIPIFTKFRSFSRFMPDEESRIIIYYLEGMA